MCLYLCECQIEVLISCSEMSSRKVAQQLFDENAGLHPTATKRQGDQRMKLEAEDHGASMTKAVHQ